MSLSVLGIVNAGLAELKQDILTSIITTTDPAQVLCNALLVAEARYLRNLGKWEQCKKRYTITFTADRVKYPVPEDFYSFVFDTSWEETQKWRMPPSQDGPFTSKLYGIGTSDAQTVFRIWGPDQNVLAGVGGQIYIDPPPSAADTASIEYYSKNLFMPPNWTASEAGITTAKYRNANGLNYKCSATTTGTCGTTAPAQTSGTFLDVGVTWTTYTAAYESIIVDTDLCPFDDDIMIKGFMWRWLKANGFPFDSEQGEYNKMLIGANGRTKPASIGSFSRAGRPLIKPRGDRDGGYFL